MDSTTPTRHTLSVYSVLWHRELGGRESWTREKVRGAAVYKAGSKIPTWLTVSPVYKRINTCRKVPLQVNFFRWRHFALPSMSLIFLRPHPFKLVTIWMWINRYSMLYVCQWCVQEFSRIQISNLFLQSLYRKFQVMGNGPACCRSSVRCNKALWLVLKS